MGLLAPVLETQGPLGGAAEWYLIFLLISTRTPLQQQHNCLIVLEGSEEIHRKQAQESKIFV